MSDPLWHKGSFLIAGLTGPYNQAGFIYRGLGMAKAFKGSPKGRRPPSWTLTHLGTGHRVCTIKAHMAEAFDLATEIADCGEWDFDSLEGWRDRDPELVNKFRAIVASHPEVGWGFGAGASEEAAREIAMARA